MSGFADKIRRGSALVYEIRRRDETGAEQFVIFQADPARHRVFLQKMEGNAPFALTDYGTVLHEGWGEPDDALKAELRRAYGMYEE
jgi:hypothetical protein